MMNYLYIYGKKTFIQLQEKLGSDRNQPILNLALHLLLAPKLSNSPLGRPLSPTGPPGLKYGPNGAPKPVENSPCAA